MSDRSIDVYFDYQSPFAYLASELLPPLAERHGAAIEWKPIDLLALSDFSEGLPYSQKKRAYVGIDAARSGELHGVTIRMPEPFPVVSGAALRVAVVARERVAFEPVHRALFRAAWRDQRDLSSEEVLAGCIEAGGGDAAVWLEEARSPAAGESLDALLGQAEAAGVFGVPTMVVDGELFWGIDSLPALEWRLSGAAHR